MRLLRPARWRLQRLFSGPVELRPFRPSDVTGVFSLLAEYGGVTLPELVSTLNENPHGPTCGAVAVDRGRIVGSYQGLPVRLLVHGETIGAFVCGRHAVHPAHVGRKLSQRLFQTAMEQMLASGWGSLAFGFPLPVALKLGTTHLQYRLVGYQDDLQLALRGSLRAHRSPFRLRRLAAKALGALAGVPRLLSPPPPPPVSKVRFAEVDRLPAELAELNARAARPGRIQIVRDSDYLQWRCFASPMAPRLRFVMARIDGQPVGYFVLHIRRRLATVGELVAAEQPEVLRDVVRHVVWLAERSGCWAVRATAPSGPVHDAFAGAGFQSVRRLPLVVRDLLDVRSELEDRVADPAAWFFSFGDTGLA